MNNSNTYHIIFYREGRNRYISSFQKKYGIRSLYLLDDTYHFNILELIPKLFTITTNNGSYRFNIELLKDTSSVITEFLEKNPSAFEYHLDINDDEKVFEKIEQMYQGKLVIFNEDELPICKKFTKLLNIKNCPNYMKPEILKTQENSYEYGLSLNDGVGLSTDNVNLFMQNGTFRTFSITTKNKEYKCNFFGVFYSKIIRDQFIENPTKMEFYYDFDDEFSEFQVICDLFNFESIDITTNNVHILKEISEDLKIDFVLEKIDKNIDEYEKVSQTIDENQALVDSNEQLFYWLYNIQQSTVDFVKNSIVESNWSKSRDDVLELAAFILQVINTDFSYHSILIDLLIKLNEEADESNYLDLLIPFIIEKLKDSFGRTLIECSFIYNLYKKGIINKDLINNEIKQVIKRSPENYGNFDRIDKNIYLWFLPELIELDLCQNEFFLIKDEENTTNCCYRSFRSNENYWKKFIQKYYPDKIDLYKNMRDSGEPDDELTKALRKDDVDTVQSIISNHKIDFINTNIPFNIYEQFVPNGEITYINYAATYGSIKCFKYLLLNHAPIDVNTFKFAVFGGNIEIVKIVDQNNPINNNNNNNKIKSENDSSIINNNIMPSIIKHQNDLFDWILQEKFSSKGVIEKSSKELIKSSVENGNAHSFIEIIDKGIDFSPYFKELVKISSEKGFFKLTQLIWNINLTKSNKEQKEENNYYSSSWREYSSFSKIAYVSFGNLSIFELSLRMKYSQVDLEDVLSYSVEKDYFNIIEYFFENLTKKNFKITQNGVLSALENSLDKDSLEIFNYLIKQFKLANPSVFTDFDGLIQLLLKACSIPCIEAVNTLTNLIIENDKNEDFTNPFLNAACSGSTEICQYFVDKNLFINYEKVSSSFSKLGSVNSDIFSIMYNNSSPEVKNTYLNLYLYPAIRNLNKNLVKFLLTLNPVCDNALIEAACSNDIEMVDIILNYKNKPSFINRQSNSGTALTIAVKKNNLEIVKRLLSLKGIDLNLCNNDKQTPLILAVSNLNIEIIDAIFNFYGEDIQNQTWQLEKALKTLLNLISSSKQNYNSVYSNATIKHNNKSLKDNSKFIKILKKFLEIENIDPNLHGDKYTILTCACEINEISLVEMLLKTSRINVNLCGLSINFTPLMVSIENNNIEIAKLLIKDHRTNINYRNSEGKTALVIAVNNLLTEIVDLLINNERFDPEESELNYAFYLSVDKVASLLFPLKSLDVNFSMIQYQSLYYDSINTIGVSDYSKLVLYDTPLVKATRLNDVNMIDLIIKHSSFDKIRSQLKKSIFIIAENDQIEIFRKLIQIEDNDVNISTADRNLLDTAVQNLSRNVITEILMNPKFDSKLNDFQSIFIGAVTKYGTFIDDENDKMLEIMNELCDYDIKHNHLIDFKSLLPTGYSFFTLRFNTNCIENYVNFLLEHGTDPNVPDENDVYPLEHAIQMESYPYVVALINSDRIDYSVKIKNKSSLYRIKKKFLTDAKYKSYLHLAARINNVEILNEFLNRNLVDINVTDDLGETPLMEAYRFQKNASVEMLFKRDDLNFLHCNNKGQDALNLFTDQQEDKIMDKEKYYNALILQIELRKNDFMDDEDGEILNDCLYKSNYCNYECIDDNDEENYEKIYGGKNNSYYENYENNYEDNYDDLYDDD